MANSSVLIFRSELITLRVADNCIWSFKSGSIYSAGTTDTMHLLIFDLSENATVIPLGLS